MDSYPKSASKQCTKKILEQLDYSFCKIYKKHVKWGNGFLCTIKYLNNNILVLITSSKIIDENFFACNNTIDISIQNKIITIEFGETKYLNTSLGLSIIEIKANKNKKLKFIEFDDNLYKKDSEFLYNNKVSIYNIQYKNENDAYISYGIINKINKSEIIFSCNINSNSNISPIFNLSNNKIIGLYKNNSKYFAKGILFDFIINGFIKEYKYSKRAFKYNNDLKNEIKILINVGPKDVNKQIYFLDNYSNAHDNLKELNKFNTELFINEKKDEYKKYFIAEKEGDYNINIKFNINLTDSSYMFAGCKNIIDINFISFNTRLIRNTKFMFHSCKKLKRKI